jgi:hypothetical protein
MVDLYFLYASCALPRPAMVGAAVETDGENMDPATKCVLWSLLVCFAACWADPWYSSSGPIRWS